VNKAPDAFRTISEVAAELELPQHVLRFWESRFPHIRPMKRGGGRRYYRPDDVELLRGIRHLLYGLGYTIRGVQRILREQGPRFVQTVWQEGAPQPVHMPEPEADERDDAPMDDEPIAPAGEAAEAADVDASAEPQRREPEIAADVEAAASIVASPPPAAAAEEHDAVEPPAEPPRWAGLRPADRDALQSALATLDACKRLLDEAFAEAEQSP
jgi:DNA-binding transcriptional MerR regulator